MHHELMGRLHAELFHAFTTLRTDEEGQGTVEYIALVLLMGGIFAVVVKTAGKGDLGIGGTISKEVKGAIDEVVKNGK